MSFQTINSLLKCLSLNCSAQLSLSLMQMEDWHIHTNQDTRQDKGRTHSRMCNFSSRSQRSPVSGRCWRSSAASCRPSVLRPHQCRNQTGSSYRRRWGWLCCDTWWSPHSGWGSGCTAAAPWRSLPPWHRRGSGPHSPPGRRCPSSPSSAQTHWCWMQAAPWASPDHHRGCCYSGHTNLRCRSAWSAGLWLTGRFSSHTRPSGRNLSLPLRGSQRKRYLSSLVPVSKGDTAVHC